MAVVGQLYGLEFVLEDGKGNIGVIYIGLGVVGDTLSIPELTDVANALEAIIDPLINGKLYRANLVMDIPGLASPVHNPDSDINDGALLSISITDSTDRLLFRFPTFNMDLIVADDIIVNTDEPDIIALYSFYEDGMVINGKTVHPCTPEPDPGEILGPVIAGAVDWQTTSHRRVSS